MGADCTDGKSGSEEQLRSGEQQRATKNPLHFRGVPYIRWLHGEELQRAGVIVAGDPVTCKEHQRIDQRQATSQAVSSNAINAIAQNGNCDQR